MKYEKGQVVYFVDRIPERGHYYVNFGVVNEEYTSEVYVNMYERRIDRLVNGVDSRDIPLVGEWKKLPKDWFNRTKEMLGITFVDDVKYYDIMSTLKPEAIKQTIESGYLVLPSQNDHMRVELDISKDGYRIVKKAGYYGDYKPDGRTLRKTEVYDTFKEAEDKVDAYFNEMMRQANMTDEEWSIAQIHDTFDTCKRLYYDTYTDEDFERMYDFLLARERIEDVETRIHNGHIEWKYADAKKWKVVE